MSRPLTPTSRERSRSAIATEGVSQQRGYLTLPQRTGGRGHPGRTMRKGGVCGPPPVPPPLCERKVAAAPCTYSRCPCPGLMAPPPLCPCRPRHQRRHRRLSSSPSPSSSAARAAAAARPLPPWWLRQSRSRARAPPANGPGRPAHRARAPPATAGGGGGGRAARATAPPGGAQQRLQHRAPARSKRADSGWGDGCA